MLLVVDAHSGVPVYRQIMEQIQLHIASGLLQAGDELPSTRNLSSDLGVNPMTVSKAYSYLEREGIVERRPGRPLVVRKLAAEESQRRRLDQLRDALAPCAVLAHQLEIDDQRALDLYRRLLAEAPTDTSKSDTSTAQSLDEPVLEEGEPS